LKRKIDDKKLLNYLLQALNVDELKQICRDYQIKGFSKLKKTELVDFILDSLAEEEIQETLNQKELEIVSKQINLAIQKINGKDRESVADIRIVNEDEHEVELRFKGFNWEVTSFISITPENLDNPERDCDCRIGSNMGFCSHFWVGFILSLKQGWFKLDDWTLTAVPEDFKKKIDSINLIPGEKSSSDSGSVGLVDESTDDVQIKRFLDKSITLYQGEIASIEEKTQTYQEIESKYYLISLSNARIGPRVQKKSDFNEKDLIDLESLNLRVSENLFLNNNLTEGMNVKANGKLTRDNFLKLYVVKNIRKIQLI